MPTPRAARLRRTAEPPWLRRRTGAPAGRGPPPPPSRRSSTGSSGFACGAPPLAAAGVFGAPPRLDGQQLAPEIHALLRLAKLSGEESTAEGRSPEQARAENRYGAAAAAGPPLPMARVEPRSIPGPAGEIPARLYVAPGAAAAAAAAARLLPRRRLDDRRPRHAGRPLSLPRRAQRRRRALGRLPARPRAPLPGRGRGRARRLRLGGGVAPQSSAPTRRGSRSAATAPAATWRPRSACSPATATAPDRRCRR